MTQAWFCLGDRVGRLDEIGDRHCVFHDYGDVPQLRPWQLPTTATVGRRPRLRVIELGFEDAEAAILGEGWTARSATISGAHQKVG